MTTMTMTTLAPPTHELERQLRTLSLSGMAQTLLARNQEAISHHLAYTEFLELLVSDEFARRRDRLFTRRLKAARVPQLKTLESFDWSFNPQIPKALILDLGMRHLPSTAAEDLLEVFTRRYETGAILVSSNRPVEDWGQVLSDTAAAGALLDRFLHHAEIIRLQGRSWRVHDRQRRRSTSPDADPPNGAQ